VTTYFITGASGVVGSALVQHILAHSTAHMVLLLRADSTEALAARLDELFNFWGILQNRMRQLASV
jgi:thioester reductase-like protein